MNDQRIPALDTAELRSRFEGKGDLLRRMIRIFSEQTPQLLARLRHAARRGDAPAVAWTAHTLKGSLSQFGANAAAELARQLEQATPPSIASLIQELEMQAGEVQQALTQLADSPEL